MVALKFIHDTVSGCLATITALERSASPHWEQRRACTTSWDSTDSIKGTQVVCQIQQVWVLVRSSVVFGTCSNTWRYLCRSKQGARCAKLEVSQVSAPDSSVPWSSWVLSAFHSRLLQDSSADDQAAPKRSQVWLEPSLWRSLLSFEDISDYCSYVGPTRYW